ncbi:MAG TPA: hypothetical protein VFK57_15660 [Vicinamibacterales bacterium]|nr:hypothetical protein [Vicinamibacterales bacterium]
MDTTLVGVTLLSLAMAAALSVIVWRMLRDERARSDARVAVLTSMAAAPAAASRQDLPLRQAPPSVGAMFTEPEQASPWGNRVAVMAGLALVIASTVLFALAAGGTRTAARGAGAPGAPAGAAVSAAGLELLSLRDSRQADTLTITGLVHNPRSGTPLTRVAVTAYAFDDNGSFLASGRALLDVTSFAPGDDSPFVVAVPVSGTVARYRIGFRTEDGRVIAHIDKRQQALVQ